MLASITCHCDDKLCFNKLLKNRHCRLLYDYGSMCVCAPYMLELSYSLLCSPKKQNSSYHFRHCALCMAYIMCFGFRINAASVAAIAPAREEKRCWDFPYIQYILVPIATKTAMRLFNRNHNSSLNGMCLCACVCVNSKHKHPATPLSHHQPYIRFMGYHWRFFGLDPTSILSLSLANTNSNVVVSFYTTHNDDMKHSKNPNNYLLYYNMKCYCCCCSCFCFC